MKRVKLFLLGAILFPLLAVVVYLIMLWPMLLLGIGTPVQDVWFVFLLSCSGGLLLSAGPK